MSRGRGYSMIYLAKKENKKRTKKKCPTCNRCGYDYRHDPQNCNRYNAEQVDAEKWRPLVDKDGNLIRQVLS